MGVAALQPWAEISQRLRLTLYKASAYSLQSFGVFFTTPSAYSLFARSLLFAALLFTFLVFPAIRLLDSKLFQTILKRPECETEEFGGLGDVVVGLLHRLCD